MKWLLFCTLSLIIAKISSDLHCTSGSISNTQNCLTNVSHLLEEGNLSPLQDLEDTLENTEVENDTSLYAGLFNTFLYVNTHSEFTGLKMYANETNATTEEIPNSVVSVQLPKEVGLPVVGLAFKLAFIIASLPQKAATKLVNSSDYLYNNRLVGISVANRTVTSLQDFVNITMNVTESINNTYRPQCVFLNTSTQSLHSDGCFTHWKRGQSLIICSCNHLTFFGVLMISNQISNQMASQVPQTDLKILTYITFIGCSISFCALLVAVLLFTIKRNIRSDVSMKIHVNLAIALFLLNMHFLPNTAMGIWEFSWPSPWLCFYMALALHFSLLASFSWMAVEGFHLYLLLVFNIYVKKYLLKLSLVGWGVPFVIVSTMVIIKTNVYGLVPVSNTSKMCYIDDDLVKLVTTVGLFGLVFLFNLIMLTLTIRHVLNMHKNNQFRPKDCNRAKKDICTLLGVITLLGTTWGLIFFSFGQLTTVGLYAFSILNPLQGLFIFLWFVMSFTKIGKETSQSTKTQS